LSQTLQAVPDGNSVAFSFTNSQRGVTISSDRTQITLGPVPKIMLYSYGVNVQSIISGSPIMCFVVNGTTIKMMGIQSPGLYSMDFIYAYNANDVIEIKIRFGKVLLSSILSNAFFTCWEIDTQ